MDRTKQNQIEEGLNDLSSSQEEGGLESEASESRAMSHSILEGNERDFEDMRKNYALARKHANGCPILGRILLEHLENEHTMGELEPREIEGIVFYETSNVGHCSRGEGVKDGVLYKYEYSPEDDKPVISKVGSYL